MILAIGKLEKICTAVRTNVRLRKTAGMSVKSLDWRPIVYTYGEDTYLRPGLGADQCEPR
jgi:hypothetical protein